MRAINAHKLKASQNNRHHWKILAEDADAWANARLAQSAHNEQRTPPAQPDEMVELQVLTASQAKEIEMLQKENEWLKKNMEHLMQPWWKRFGSKP